MLRAAAAALVLTGLMAGVAQVLMARELLDVFYGDEICVGLLLGSWLLWVAVGSAVVARVGGRDGPPNGPPVLAFGVLLMVTPVLLIGQIACARAIPATVVGLKGWVSAKAVALPWLNGLAKLLPGTEGELIGLVPMIACIVVVMAPVCVVEGLQFVLGCRVYAAARRKGKGGGQVGGGEAIGGAYVWDAVGHLGAGALLSFALVYRVSGMTHAALAGVAAAAGALWLLWAAHQEMGAPRFRVGAVTASRVLIVLLVPALAGWMERIDGAMMRVRWRGQELVAHARTPYGSLAVTRRGSVHSFFASGLLMFDSPDPVNAEWMTHMAMLQHRRPRRVLLIGGAGGKLAEILKHGPDRVDYVELDEWVVRLGREYWAAEAAAALDDPAVRVHVTDGRAFIKAGKGVEGEGTGPAYDVVIVALPDPFTTQLSRFYSEEFFGEVRRAMSEEGVFCCAITSSPDYLDSALLAFDACVYRTMQRAFAEVAGVPGETMLIMGARQQGVLTRDALTLLGRVWGRGIETSVFQSLLMDRMQENRITYVDGALRDAPEVELNTDLQPRGYYYRQRLSAAWFGPGTRRVFDALGRLRLWHVVLLAGALLAGLAPFVRHRAADRVYVPVLMASVGFAGMVLQIALLLAFQALCGSVYHKIGLLTGAFMLGLAAGGSWMSRRLRGVRQPLWVLVVIQACIVGYAAVLAPQLVEALGASSRPGALIGVQILFPVLMAAAGSLVGAAFPLAGRAQLEAQAERAEGDGGDVGGAAGTLYAADLIGACGGGLVAGTVLVPVLGMAQACLVAAVVCVPGGCLVALRASMGRTG
jgi:spermidine synthase